MAQIPLRFISISQFLGEQEGLDSLSLADVFGASCRNVYLDKFARIRSILGYAKQNAAAIVSAGALPVKVRGLYHYVNQAAAGVVSRQLLAIVDDGVSCWELHTSADLGSTWTLVENFGASSVGATPDFAQAGNDLILTNGVIAPRSWDGTTLDLAGDSAQLAAPSALNAAVSGLLKGTYYWKIRPIRSDGTTLSASATSAQLALQNSQASLAWIAHTDPTVVGYQVLRTSGSGRTFFLESFVAGIGTVAFTSSISDEVLIQNSSLDRHGDAPLAGMRFCEMSGSKMWYFGTAANPRNLYHADPGYPESVYSDQNFINLTDAENWSDKGVGLTGDYEGMTIAWMERSVWTISGTGRVIGTVRDYSPRRADAVVGTVSHRTVARIPRGAMYVDDRGALVKTDKTLLAYLTPTGEVRLFNGNHAEVCSSAKMDRLSTLNYQSRHTSFCLEDTVRSEVAWVFPSGAADAPNMAVVWNYKYGVWFERDWPFGHAVRADTESDVSVLVGGAALATVGGYVYKLWESASFDGAEISWRWTSTPLYGAGQANDKVGLPGQPLIMFDKRWRWADVLVKHTQAIDVHWAVLDAEGADTELASGTIPADSVGIRTSDGQPIETSDASIILAVDVPALPRLELASSTGEYIHARGIRLRLSGSDDAGQAIIGGLVLAFQLLVGLKRDSRH